MAYRERNWGGYEIKWRSLSQDDLAFFVTSERWNAWSVEPVFVALSEILLTIGGEVIVPPAIMPPDRFNEAEIQKVVSHGKFYPGTPVCLIPGQQSRCHRNMARLWKPGGTFAICTGYALSKDGRWRDHTWGVATEPMPCGDLDIIGPGDVIETTESRVCYYGYLLTHGQASRFVRNNA